MNADGQPRTSGRLTVDELDALTDGGEVRRELRGSMTRPTVVADTRRSWTHGDAACRPAIRASRCSTTSSTAGDVPPA